MAHDDEITPDQYAARAERAVRRAWAVLLDVTEQEDAHLRKLALDRMSNGTLQGLRDVLPIAIEQFNDFHPTAMENGQQPRGNRSCT